MLKGTKIRIAKPAIDLEETKEFYTTVLQMELLGGFQDHDGFDGIMLGYIGEPYHLEFTCSAASEIQPSSTSEDLLVFYIPESEKYTQVIKHIEDLGQEAVASHNPYWDKIGRTFMDPNGYRIVICLG